MKIAFTICSANYLAYGKSLADSVLKHNPDYRFFIALLDSYQDYDPLFFTPHTVLRLTEKDFPLLPGMAERYNTFELSCALKPFVAEYLFNQHEASSAVFYFDADILVFNRLIVAEEILCKHSLVLTPHISNGTPGNAALEVLLLRSGIYNGGFFGVGKTSEGLQFLAWWKDRLFNYCIDDFSKGLFVDQLWLNHAPVLFKNTFILHDPGYNHAYWNFPERTLTVENGEYKVNHHHPLVFFHFSGYDLQQPDKISRHQATYTFVNSPAYIPLFEHYRSSFAQNNSPGFSALPSTIGKPVPAGVRREKNFFKRKFQQIFKRRA